MDAPPDPRLAGVIPARAVKPRRTGYVHMPIVAVHEDPNGSMDVTTGEVLPDYYLQAEDGTRTRDIARYVGTGKPSIVVTTDPPRLVALLEETFPSSVLRYTMNRAQRERGQLVGSQVKLSSFGFAPVPGKRASRRHQCWDPHTVSPTAWHKFLDELTHESLILWAQDVRGWLESQDLTPRNALAGYAAQLLRDPRFYPEPRRRVPRATNERARPSLPGNLTRIYVKPGLTMYNVVNIDQSRAHHRIVQEIDLPCANTLWARGYFGNPDTPDYWTRKGQPAYERLVNMPGLLYVGMYSHSTSRKAPFRMPIQDYNGFRRVFMYTNAVDFVESHGSTIEGIYAAWTSDGCDTGLARYGEFAHGEIDAADTQRVRWLKPLLHSTYGLLAARPRALEVGHNVARGGIGTDFIFGKRIFRVQMTTLKEWQPAITNVIQRGMIEAETQIRSLKMAEHVTAAGCQVLHIHTDGVHVTGQLPIDIPATWKMETLTNITYLDDQSWRANERECLPGRESKNAKLHTDATDSRTDRRSNRNTQRTEERAKVVSGGTNKPDVGINQSTGTGKVARTSPQHSTRNSAHTVDPQDPRIVRLPPKRRKRAYAASTSRDTLRGVQSTALDSLARAIPYGVYGKPNERFGMSEQTQEGATITTDQVGADRIIKAPTRAGGNASFTAADMDLFRSMTQDGRLGKGDAFVTNSEVVGKENTARNRARSFARKYNEDHGVILVAHAVKVEGGYVPAVSVRSDQPDQRVKQEDTSEDTDTPQEDGAGDAAAIADPPSGADAAHQAQQEDSEDSDDSSSDDAPAKGSRSRSRSRR